MNRYIFGALIIAVLIIAFVFLPADGQKSTLNAKVASTITVAETPYDFGDIDIFGGKVSTTYTLINTGTEDVSITSAVTSCMCTEGEIGGLTFGMHESSGDMIIIPAGGEKILTATFDPLAHGPEGTGKIKRELYLKTNSTATPEIKVTFSGNVVKNKNDQQEDLAI